MDLYFKNAVFHEGWNLTVRRGVKWDLVSGAEAIWIKDIENPHALNCVAGFDTRVIPFNQLISRDLVEEHDPECRTYFGLLEVMRDVYPGFDEREVVTLVRFYVPCKIS